MVIGGEITCNYGGKAYTICVGKVRALFFFIVMESLLNTNRCNELAISHGERLVVGRGVSAMQGAASCMCFSRCFAVLHCYK